jgi:hypothetical protein
MKIGREESGPGSNRNAGSSFQIMTKSKRRTDVPQKRERGIADQTQATEAHDRAGDRSRRRSCASVEILLQGSLRAFAVEDRPNAKTPPPGGDGVFCVHESKRGSFLSFAGLAATYSPRA